jgi:hypothetical protein
LERDSSSQSVVTSSFQQSGENLIPLGPTRRIPPLRGSHELVTVIERQLVIVGRPGA